MDVQQLVLIGFLEIDAHEILRKRVKKRQDDPEFWGQVGYKEREGNNVGFKNLQRCSACGSLVFCSFHKAFACGHLDCAWKDKPIESHELP